jgi:hypothetical protein
MTSPSLLRDTNPDVPTTNRELWEALWGVASFGLRLSAAGLSDEDPPLYVTKDGQLVFTLSPRFVVHIQRRRADSVGLRTPLDSPWGVGSLTPAGARHLRSTDDLLKGIEQQARDHPDKLVAVYDPVVEACRPVFVDVSGQEYRPWLNVRLPDAIVIGLQQAFGRELQDRLTRPQID